MKSKNHKKGQSNDATLVTATQQQQQQQHQQPITMNTTTPSISKDSGITKDNEKTATTKQQKQQ